MASTLIARALFPYIGEVLKVKHITSVGIVLNRKIWLDSPQFGKSFADRIWKEDLPKPGTGRAFRRIVHYEDEYTVKPLNVTNLAGRDPVTGRVIAKGIGGGIKHKYHWIAWKREGPKEGKPIEERVIQIMDDGCRTAKIALVAGEDKLKYILATENMKAGDIIKTSGHIPRIPVRANEGDAYPLGALPMGTRVHNIERFPGKGSYYVHAAGSYATLLRRIGDKIIVQMPSKHEFSFSQECMAVIGRLSNLMHSKTPIGSAQRLRELGYRPRSGLWQRKSGRHGRKIRPLPPVRVLDAPRAKRPEPIVLSMPDP
ncbi:large ribosomal subunit protein uL2m [Periplaneta americana]|uniref:39S ribosomal protein L2, mitochondrial n=1 Tax=Periplaneta americana TaxID=6978 RepID=A0ABQ8S8B0_PERAM|nr:hypothetical protein ANN_22382 [Periplaneta americana]